MFLLFSNNIYKETMNYNTTGGEVVQPGLSVTRVREHMAEDHDVEGSKVSQNIENPSLLTFIFSYAR